MDSPLPGSVPSPNIWHHPQVYELENRAVDSEGRIEAAMRAVRPWASVAQRDRLFGLAERTGRVVSPTPLTTS